ncbi:hypothetical protein LL06_00845 [Hoeflea sp. BAL378]|uniref:hypothetical protein n=1 Tax=Hoeflea sp. BAL378 TaxID=1547437 RepID=UPI0005139A9D|nr:hypothetical protein [Hoeflea sp. BAL378]KGF71173.1 hypothetical protein LL06_00845 [Hoeflea sp. BAL378]
MTPLQSPRLTIVTNHPVRAVPAVLGVEVRPSWVAVVTTVEGVRGLAPGARVIGQWFEPRKYRSALEWAFIDRRLAGDLVGLSLEDCEKLAERADRARAERRRARRGRLQHASKFQSARRLRRHGDQRTEDLMTIHLHVGRPKAGFPPAIKQEAIVALWQAGFDHEEIGAAVSVHPGRVASVLDLVREQTGALRPAPPEKMR